VAELQIKEDYVAVTAEDQAEAAEMEIITQVLVPLAILAAELEGREIEAGYLDTTQAEEVAELELLAVQAMVATLAGREEMAHLILEILTLAEAAEVDTITLAEPQALEAEDLVMEVAALVVKHKATQHFLVAVVARVALNPAPQITAEMVIEEY
jgi:hypothetical protein